MSSKTAASICFPRLYGLLGLGIKDPLRVKRLMYVIDDISSAIRCAAPEKQCHCGSREREWAFQVVSSCNLESLRRDQRSRKIRRITYPLKPVYWFAILSKSTKLRISEQHFTLLPRRSQNF